MCVPWPLVSVETDDQLRLHHVVDRVVLRRDAAVAGAVLVERVELPVAGVDDGHADVAAPDAGVVQVARVHVDGHRIAFAEGGGVGDLDIVDVDVVVADSGRSSRRTKRMAVLRPR